MNDSPELAEASEPTYRDHLRWKLQDISYRTTIRWRQFCDWLKWVGHVEGNLEQHARRELEIAGLFDKDSDYGGMVGAAVMQMMQGFSEEGHSGFSAGMTSSIFNKVSRFEPLTPLTGNDDEWGGDHMDGDTLQNKRCSHVFKKISTGLAYDINGKIFREPDGSIYTGSGSRVDITFPYTPKSEYVDVEKNHE